MQRSAPKSLHWPGVLAALRTCEGECVFLRTGTTSEPAGEIRTRPAARGTEFCLFEGEAPVARVALIERLEHLAASPDRRFAAAARIHVDGSFELVERVMNDSIAGAACAVIIARNSGGRFEPLRGKAPHTTGRSKRIKTG
ncbi:MAG: hypothetical protein HKL91_00350 [Candidatus Eremiobacteraeota bacterium]|uniref:Uncharacterized protein n=1 Tax=mine drainage metagenome TaxID=410659 RepID=E6PF70_9ZZZZ|nr:hypothetical protein [Candidatus Eremiobacteraeota bacterium]